jgi:protein-L-isoaspartate(D-aspartate) O-methyltransferase
MIEHHHARGLGLASDASRKRLIDEVRRWGVKDERVLTALAAVPRHEFLEDAFKGRAYENNALPIGLSQTISQPYIVALMTEAILQGGKPHKVLEIGTGSGYQTAVLAELVPAVFTVERLKPLSQLAPGGRLVIPVGTQGQQSLKLITRTGAGLVTRTLGDVSFVPLLGGRG